MIATLADFLKNRDDVEKIILFISLFYFPSIFIGKDIYERCYERCDG